MIFVPLLPQEPETLSSKLLATGAAFDRNLRYQGDGQMTVCQTGSLHHFCANHIAQPSCATISSLSCLSAYHILVTTG